MNDNVKIRVTAELWIKDQMNKAVRLATLADINRIMCQIVRDRSDELINDGEAFDMLHTLTSLSMFVKSLEECYEDDK